MAKVEYLPGANVIWTDHDEWSKQIKDWDQHGANDIDRVIIRGIELFPHDSVLDLAMGVGRWYNFLEPDQYTGVDGSTLMVEEVRRRFKNNSNVTITLSRIEDVHPLLHSDLALLVHVMNHCVAPEELLDVVLHNLGDRVDRVATSYYVHDYNGERYLDFGAPMGILSRSVEPKWVDEVIAKHGWLVVFREDIPDHAHELKHLRVRVDILSRTPLKAVVPPPVKKPRGRPRKHTDDSA